MCTLYTSKMALGHKVNMYSSQRIKNKQTKKKVLSTVNAYLHQMGAHCCNERRVILHHGRKAHRKFGLTETRTAEHNIGALAPGHKVKIVFDLGHHVIHLLHGIPEHR